MTSESSIDDREVIFINERCRVDYQAIPEPVLESADQAIDTLQNGRQLPPKMFRSLKRNLAGIDEIRLPYDDDTYRIYVYQGCPSVIMVLDAGIKKSTEGGNIPKWQTERLETRLSTARRYCKDNGDALKSAHESRKARKAVFENATTAKPKKESRR
jgi:hypothetical protein